MFRKNALLLGFLVIMVIGMLACLLAWGIKNNLPDSSTLNMPPISITDKFPQGKIILELLEVDTNISDEELEEALLKLPGVKKAVFFPERNLMVVFYEPSQICIEGIMSPLKEKGISVKPFPKKVYFSA